MIEQKLEKLTEAVTQLTVTIEALLETQRTKADEAAPKKAKKEKAPAPVASQPEVVTGSVEQPQPVPFVTLQDPNGAVASEAVKTALAAASTITLEDIRAAAQQLLDGGKGALIKAITKEFGVTRLSEISVQQYPIIMDRLTKGANGSS